MPVSLVQFFNGNGDRIKPGYGYDVGAAAATNAQLLGAPKGITLWLDAEWSKNLPSSAAVWQYCCEWADRVEAGGYEPGIYVGSGNPLNSDALYGLPKFRHYWRAASIVPQVRRRGWQMVQGMPQKVHGVEIDPDIAALDHKGERFKIIWP
jgi:GH25 family lysozyme M1 (1,4-beta-N-acetylmuramidase)